MKMTRHDSFLWKISLFVILFFSSPISAEIILDGTLGGPKGILKSQEIQYGQLFPISASIGKQVGDNLFHSFEIFNLHPDEIASFGGPENIQNIISRVTGDHPSYINGTIHSAIPNADLYFLNPAGILFGPNARLSVYGSFYASTADYLRLAEGGRFDASHPKSTVLKVAPPTAFGFLTDLPAGISKQGAFLILPAQKTLSLIGGDLKIEDGQYLVEKNWRNSFMGTSGGRINLISVADSLEVPIDPDNLPDNPFQTFGKITLTDSSPKDSQRQSANLDVSGAGGGSVYIRAGQLFMDNAQIWADTLGHENGLDIKVKVNDELTLTQGSRITAQVVKKGELTPTGQAGNIIITANRIHLNGGSQIDSSTQLGTAGSAGYISLSAQEQIKISGCLANNDDSCFVKSNGFSEGFIYSGIQNSTAGTGQGEEIRIKTPILTLTENAVIRADTQNIGNAGEINIQVEKLILTKGGQIKSSSGQHNMIQVTGSGGKLRIKATENIAIKGKGIQGQSSGLFSNAFTQGQGGKIEIIVPNLSLEAGGSIQAAAQGRGNAGDLLLNVDKMTLNNSTIVTHSVNSAGGDITIKSKEQLYLINSRFSTQTIGLDKQNKGGNITLSQPKWMILNNSKLISSGFVGDGGNIKLSAQYSIESSDSLLNAASTLGVDGEVQIDASIEYFNEINLLAKQFRRSSVSVDECVIDNLKELSHFQYQTRRGLFSHPNDLQK
jgi:filamentous hemagglutinin family protein